MSLRVIDINATYLSEHYIARVVKLSAAPQNEHGADAQKKPFHFTALSVWVRLIRAHFKTVVDEATRNFFFDN